MMMGDFALSAQVAAFIAQNRLLSPGDRVLVAVSGGADSVALLTLLLEMREALGISVTVAHYEHGIRGEASREDARFVQAFCAEWGVSCQVGHGDVPELAARTKCSLEDAARQARYAFLEEAAESAGANKIALAHQLEDQAETLLLHLVHGCGLDGLAAMRPRQGNRIRPLLDTPRAALEEYLRVRGIVWREDATNLDTVHARNLLRREVFPLLRRLNPRAAEAMARTAAQAAQAADRQAVYAAAALVGHVKWLPYGAFWLLEGQSPMPEAVRAFARWAGVPPLDARQTDEVTRLAPGEMANLPEGWRALRTARRMHLLAPKPAVPILDEAAFAREACGLADLGDGIRVQAFDADKLDGAAFRFRREGDVFAPLGSDGTQKLKRTLQDAGIDRPFRSHMPVLARGNRVLWIVGLRPARDAAVTPETERAMRIRYMGDLPWEITPNEDGNQ